MTIQSSTESRKINYVMQKAGLPYYSIYRSPLMTNTDDNFEGEKSVTVIGCHRFLHTEQILENIWQRFSLHSYLHSTPRSESKCPF